MNYRSIDLSTLNQELSTLVCSVCLDTANKSRKNWIPAHRNSEHKHHMCKECYEQVSIRNKKCPLCRTDINDLEIIPKVGAAQTLTMRWTRFWYHRDRDGFDWYLTFKSPRQTILTRSWRFFEGRYISLTVRKNTIKFTFTAEKPLTMQQIKAISELESAVVKIESLTSASVTFRRAHLKIELSLVDSSF